MSDQFSTQSAQYAQFRPGYPEELYAFILAQVPDKQVAWDCGTGNGQAAVRLAQEFELVEATDMSAAQLDKAPAVANIRYTACNAESTAFPDRHFDLVTVAQALHWFHFADFFEEVDRVAKQGAIFAAWTYALCEAPPGINELVQNFYLSEMRPWFKEGRQHIDDRYGSIPFPFPLMDTPAFYLDVDWNKTQVEGFLESWSAVQHYIKAHDGKSPVPGFMDRLEKAWPAGSETVQFRFPLTLKMGRVEDLGRRI